MKKKVLFLFFLILAACSDDESLKNNPLDAVETSSSLEEEISSSMTVSYSSSKGKSSSSQEDSSSSLVASSSNEDDVSSSSKEKSSSSQEGSSSSLVASSSNEDDVSSSSKEKSSSSQEDSSSSLVASSSNEDDVSSSSKEKSSSSQEDSSSSLVASSSNEDDVSSSSKEKSSSSSATIPSKLYDCEKYKCVTTKHLNPEIDYGEYLDIRDSLVYRTVQIGEQVWMAQNLNFSIEGSFCYSNDSLNCNTNGRMYQWILARRVCPDGWHLPDTADFGILRNFAEQNNGGIPVGKSLISGKNDVFGFASLVNGGYQTGPNGKFSQKDKQFYWTNTADAENEYYAKVRYLYKTGDYLAVETFQKTWSLSVRCVKD